MQLYIVRHATPAASTGDPDLNEQGRDEAAQLGTLFGRLNLPPGSVAVVASTLKRARQTAEAIAAAVGVPAANIGTFPPAAGPNPTSPGAALKLLLQQFPPANPPAHVVLVGHWGSVNTLYAWLIGVAASHFPEDKAAAAAVLFDLPPVEKSGRLLWLVRPALLPPGETQPPTPPQENGMPGSIVAAGAVEFVGTIVKDKDVSAVDVAGDWLLIGSDETNLVQLLKRSGAGYEVVRDVVLDPAAEEIDIEGIAHDGEWYYVLGSHSFKRKKLDPEKSYQKNLEALAKVTAEPDRDRVCRFRLAADGTPTDLEETSLRAFLNGHPVLKPFAAIPGKQNGIDLEGIAVHDGWTYIGFRSPILRGNVVPVLKCRFASPAADVSLSYVDLGGRGVRDLVRVPDGFLILAGPGGEGPGSYQLYLWDGGDCLPGTRTAADLPAGHLRLLGDLPGDGAARAEAIAVLAEDDAKYELLIVFDGEPNGAPTRFTVAKA